MHYKINFLNKKFIAFFIPEYNLLPEFCFVCICILRLKEFDTPIALVLKGFIWYILWCITVYNNIVLNQGHVEIIKAGAGDFPIMTYYDNESSVMVYNKDSILYVEANEPDVHLLLDINNLQTSYIQIMTGTIKATAVASKKSKNHIRMGAIVLNINKEEIGSLYMRVNTGTIIANSCIQVALHKTKGYEAYFQGALQHQHTVLIVEAGAIICRII